MQKSLNKGRAATSVTCRNWMRRRHDERELGIQSPLWVIMFPPWPVRRLQFRMQGRSILSAVLITPIQILAASDTDC